MKRWAEAWERAAIALDKIKTQELRAPDYYEKNLPFLLEGLEYAVKNSPIELTSGMVEMQKYIKKLKQLDNSF